jgi:hypothetical protein
MEKDFLMETSLFYAPLHKLINLSFVVIIVTVRVHEHCSFFNNIICELNVAASHFHVYFRISVSSLSGL